MSKVINDQVEKVELMISGLRKHPEIISKLGFELSAISNLEIENKTLNVQNKELEQLSQQTKAASKKANSKLDDVRKQFQEIKKKVKLSIEPSKWEQVGVLDKR